MNQGKRLLGLGFLLGAMSGGVTAYCIGSVFHTGMLTGCGLGMTVGILTFIAYLALLTKLGK